MQLFALILIFIISSCKKEKEQATNVRDNPVPQSNSRAIKYEISGNYSGQLFVVYYDNISGNSIDTVKSLPWSKEIVYAANVSGIGIAANSITGHLGAPSQSATIKIYSAGNSVKTQSSVTDINGIINIPSIAYVFQ